MNEIFQEFVDVLKDPEHSSGNFNYKPIVGKLRKGNCFCATGVLCDLLCKKDPIRYSWKRDFPTESIGHQSQQTFRFNDRNHNYYSITNLPNYILEGMGVTEQIEIETAIRDVITCTASNWYLFKLADQISILNDCGMPWPEIAGVIERNLNSGENDHE